MATRRRRRGAGVDYLGAGDVACILGVSTTRVRQLALSGELREARRVSGRRLYDPAAVEAYRRKRAKRTR